MDIQMGTGNREVLTFTKNARKSCPHCGLHFKAKEDKQHNTYKTNSKNSLKFKLYTSIKKHSTIKVVVQGY